MESPELMGQPIYLTVKVRQTAMDNQKAAKNSLNVHSESYATLLGWNTGPRLTTTDRATSPETQIHRWKLVTMNHPMKALKVFFMILFDVVAEINCERKYRKEFKA